MFKKLTAVMLLCIPLFCLSQTQKDDENIIEIIGCASLQGTLMIMGNTPYVNATDDTVIVIHPGDKKAYCTYPGCQITVSQNNNWIGFFTYDERNMLIVWARSGTASFTLQEEPDGKTLQCIDNRISRKK